MVSIRQIINERESLLYSHIPLSVFRNSGKWPEPQYDYALFLYTNDDSERITEWITYHRTLGFKHFYIYSFHKNPETFYKKLIPFISTDPLLITYHHYPSPGNLKQAFYHYFHYYGHESEWIMSLNIDEFLCLKSHSHLLTYTHTIASECEAFYFNICTYGHNNFETAPVNEDILLNYTLRSEAVSTKTRVLIKNQSIPCHALFQSQSNDFMTNYLHLDPDLKTCNVLGNSVDLYFADYPTSAITYLQNQKRFQQMTDIAYIAHFGIPSIEFVNQQLDRPFFEFYAGDRLNIETTQAQLETYGEITNLVEDSFLQNKWIEILINVWEKSVFPISFWSLLSENKVAEQSSTEHNCSPIEDAAQLINGKPIGHAQNLTKKENSPWWSIDLKSVCSIHEIHIFNRLDHITKEFTCFEIHISEEKINWTCIFKKNKPSLFGGMDGSPFIWTSEKGVLGRYVKFTLPGENKQIALDQIQIFGQEITTI